MGLHTPPSYKVLRKGKWIWIHPEPQDYFTGDVYTPIDLGTSKSKYKRGGRRNTNT